VNRVGAVAAIAGCLAHSRNAMSFDRLSARRAGIDTKN
jgi:hypothetical protein